MLRVDLERFGLVEAFTIARGSRSNVDVVTVQVMRDGVCGRGEGVPSPRHGETQGSVHAQISALPDGISRAELQGALPCGAARNAMDCALWDLEAKRSGLRFWELAGRAAPVPQVTAFTLSLDTAALMEAAARRHAWRPLLKIKLGGVADMIKLEAVRRGAPDARLIVDANEGWSLEEYADLAPHLLRLGVEMVEQPLPAGGDDMLSEIVRPLPVCADESCLDRSSLPALAGKYDMVNVKLDKAGGLTEALALADAARAAGFLVMVGSMLGSSLSAAPAVLVAQGAAVVDLDGPLLLAQDRDHSLRYDGDGVHPPEPALWG